MGVRHMTEAGRGVTWREAVRPGRLEEGGRGEPVASMRTAGKTVGSQEGL